MQAVGLLLLVLVTAVVNAKWATVSANDSRPKFDYSTAEKRVHRHQKHRMESEDSGTYNSTSDAAKDAVPDDRLLYLPQHQIQKQTSIDRAQQQAPTPRPYPGRHVCTHEETVTRPVRVVESYCKPAYKSFTQRCLNGTMCTAYKVQYDTIYRTTIKYQTTTEKKHACCPGWTYSVKQTHGCTQAVCSTVCKNGGSCVKPNHCACPPGYTGATCEADLDECSNSSSHKCQQICVNTVGNYTCSCHEGFQLQEDGRSCKFRLESVPQLQLLLQNYEAMAKRVALLEQESKERSASVAQVDVVEYQTTIGNMTQQILALEDKLNQINETANGSNSVESNESSNSDSLTSLSEQVAILEERLADCTCIMAPADNKVKTRP